MSEQIWAQLKEKLPFETDADSTERRAKYWAGFDVNGNGYISLAELDKGVRDILQLPQLFDLKPVLLRAFNAAKEKLKAKSTHGDDFVSKAQFRYCLLYLRQYYEYWIAFDLVDTGDDRRIDIGQFKKAVPVLAKWGIKIEDPEVCFKQIDKDHGGQILFIEFANWAIKKQLDLDNDDDLV